MRLQYWRIDMREKPKDLWIMRTPKNRGANTLNLIGGMALVLVCALLATGCATPKVHPGDPQLILESNLLGFLQDGVTTREDVILRLGIPSAQIEGEKILMYQLKADESGKWHLIAPRWNVNTGLRTWSEGTSSLVLVFGQNGVLRKHSLVIAQ
jgi:hypothetical protein